MWAQLISVLDSGGTAKNLSPVKGKGHQITLCHSLKGELITCNLDCSWWHSRCCSKYLSETRFYRLHSRSRSSDIYLHSFRTPIDQPAEHQQINSSVFFGWKCWLLGPNSSEVGIFSQWKIRRKQCPSEASRWSRVLDLLSEIPASLQVRLATTGDPSDFWSNRNRAKDGDSDRFIVDLLSNDHDLSIETSWRWAFTQ